MGYFDPLYYETGFLTKESDVYSFGVVLFEVLCGRLCVEPYDDIRRFLAKLAQKCYEEKKLDTIINSSVKEQISPLCLQIFSEVAYQCLRRDRKERPSMPHIVNKLEIALQYQEEYEFMKKKKMMSTVVLDFESDEYWDSKLPPNVEAIIKKFNIPHATTKKELFSLLHKGCYFDDNNQFIWIDNDGNKCLAISAKGILEYNQLKYTSWMHDYNPSCSFTSGAAVYHINKGSYNCKIKTSMLSLGTMYTASLMFTFHVNSIPSNMKLMRIKWRTEGLSVHSIHCAHRAEEREWYSIKMWHFNNHELDIDFNIVIEEFSNYEDRDKSHPLLLLGIEFQPTAMMRENEEFKGLSITDEDEEDIGENNNEEYWEKKLPNDYHRYIEMSDKPLEYTTKKELYLSLCQGFLGCFSQLWFSLCKSTRGICSIQPATQILSDKLHSKHIKTLSLFESRFKEVKQLAGTCDEYNFSCRLGSFMFSPHYAYACYLVFKFDEDKFLSNDSCCYKVDYNSGSNNIQGALFVNFNVTSTTNIPIIEPRKDIEWRDLSKSIRMPKHYMDPEQSRVEKRNDGWMEFRLTEPLHQLENHESLEVKLQEHEFGSLKGMIVEGIEFRPVVHEGSYIMAGSSTKHKLIGTDLHRTNDNEKNEVDIHDDDDDDWEKKLPYDYQHYIEMSKRPLVYTTKKELYLLLCNGFLASNDNGQLWFSTCKSTRGICSILSALYVLSEDYNTHKLETLFLYESRFKQVKKLGNDGWYYWLTCTLGSLKFSHNYSYACYLVFKFEGDHVLSNDGPSFRAVYNLGGHDIKVLVSSKLDLTSLITIQTKSIEGVGMLKVYTDPKKSWVEKRYDGWMEARLTRPLKKHELENHEELMVSIERMKDSSFSGMIVEGVEFRPVVMDGSYLVVERSTKSN